MTTQNNKENIRIVRAYFSIKNLKKIARTYHQKEYLGLSKQ